MTTVYNKDYSGNVINYRGQEFSSGGPGQSDKKKNSDNLYYIVLSLFYWNQMVNWLISKKTIIFQGSRGSPTFSKGVHLFPGGPIAYSL